MSSCRSVAIRVRTRSSSSRRATLIRCIADIAIDNRSAAALTDHHRRQMGGAMRKSRLAGTGLTSPSAEIARTRKR